MPGVLHGVAIGANVEGWHAGRSVGQWEQDCGLRWQMPALQPRDEGGNLKPEGGTDRNRFRNPALGPKAQASATPPSDSRPPPSGLRPPPFTPRDGGGNLKPEGGGTGVTATSSAGRRPPFLDIPGHGHEDGEELIGFPQQTIDQVRTDLAVVMQKLQP